MKIGNRIIQRNYPEISSLVKDLANQIERKKHADLQCEDNLLFKIKIRSIK